MYLIAIFWILWLLIIYTYLLFPIIIDFISKKKGNKYDFGGFETPRVVMIVSAYNEEKVIREKIFNTWLIDYPSDKFSIVIGSDGSSDNTVDIIREFDNDRLHLHAFPKRRGKISVLNDLVKYAVNDLHADVIVMSDANTMFGSDAVRLLVRPFQDPKIGCVSGEIVLEQEGGVSGEGFYWKYEGWIKRNESRLGFLIGCNGGIFAIRSELFKPLPDSIIVEDFVMTMKLLEDGWKIIFEPNARGTEPPSPSTKAEMIRKVRIGAGNFQALTLTNRLLGPKYGLISFAYWGHKVLRWFVPVFFLLAFLVNIALCNYFLYSLILFLQILGGLVAVYSYKITPDRKINKIFKMISYFYLMNYALMCGLIRFIFGTQRVTWDKVAN